MYSANSWKLASFRTYAQAKNYWESVKPWRGKDPNIRPAGTRRQTSITVRKDNDDFVVRYHHTDVIRFRPDGVFEFEAYASMSTNNIARQFTPSGVTLDYNAHGFFVGIIDRKTQDWVMTKVSKKFRLHPAGDKRWIIEGAQPIERKLVDVKAANKIYKEHNYIDFAAFMRAAEKLNPPENVRSWEKYKQRWDRFVTHQYVIEMFQDGLQGWHILADKLPRPTQTLEIVRAHLIKSYGCIKTVEVESLDGWRAVRSVSSYNRKWS